MLRTLAWKEWREQRPIVLAGIAIGMALPFVLMAGAATRARGLEMGDVVMVLPGFYGALLWPLFAAAAGAATLATERGEGTLSFLLSRPISRRRIWSVKVALGAVATLMIVVVTALVAELLRAIVPSPVAHGWQSPWGNVGVPWTGMLLGNLGLLFAASVFFSTLLPRTMTAAAAGLATSLALEAGILLLWSMTDVVPQFAPEWPALQMLLAAALLLGGSLWVFARGEMLRGRRFRRTVLGVAGIVAGLLVLGSVPLLYGALRLTPATAVFRDLIVTPDGGAIVARVSDDDYGSSQIWSIPADGAGYMRLTGRLALGPEISPDGTLVAYVSLRGPFGLRSRRAELRLVRTDGTGDRRLLADLGTVSADDYRYLDTSMAFSADGGHLALLADDRLDVIDVNGGGRHQHDLGARGPGWFHLIGWTPDGAEVLLYESRRESAGPSASLNALDVETGDTRELWTGAGMLWPLMIQRSSVGKLVVVQAAGVTENNRRMYQALLLDLTTGRAEPLVKGFCGARADLSGDGRWLAYSECDEPQGPVRLHLRDLASGEDRLVAETGECPVRLLLAPRADRLLVVAGVGEGPSFVVDADGATHPLEPGWQPLGWSGRDRLLLAEPARDGEPPRLLVSGATGEDVRRLYP